MALEATYGFMVWNENSPGTLFNVLRFLRQGKKVVVYLTPVHWFADLRSPDQWEDFLHPTVWSFGQRWNRGSILKNARTGK